ncbi:hypothetical protein GYMLUDRAFT_96567 [Collybiopsis luxurians FD-317 M1]|uniref:Unplaced genomic scaffold GYMLUscaffold_22, whole genome shotgun sequence n=1 Tax=Collybiopsis luxurians FD-317 M1 TaxID=944289 RepID=A0A0D0CGF9_9AGAR|nr:hypothetical protein GYMLUDRAFT_96567 [Collybiopsis luxurians FD-317 M1]
MGFFKRILSLGSKKSSSKRKQAQTTNQGTAWVDEVGAQTGHPVVADEDNEIAANLLLRSSSARYAVIAETDITSLPPLPHPINSAINTPTGSTTSLPASAGANMNIARRGTYTVKVHPKQQHTCTEFPLANRGQPESQPRRRAQTVGPAVTLGLDEASESSSSHLQGLRRDPSVASLLDLYDEHGRLPSKAFSNTPPRERQGRAQTQRAGSTLRELLGEAHRHSTSNSLEGDISWAERFLGEANSTSAASSVSSLILQTPDSENIDSFAAPRSRFSDSLLLDSKIYAHGPHDSTFIPDHDRSISSTSSFMIHNDPTISSMEVELSAVTDQSQISQVFDTYNSHVPENPHIDPKTPRRASEVFGFLTEKKQKRDSHTSIEEAQTLERPLPEPPSTFSSPSDKDSYEGPALSRFSANTSEYNVSPCSSSAHRRHSRAGSCGVDVFNDNPDSCCTEGQKTVSRILSGDETCINVEDAFQIPRTRVIMTGPTKVIVTAPTPMADGCERPTGHIPRGPRSLHDHRQRSRSRSRNSLMKAKEYRPGLVERSNSHNRVAYSPEDPFTAVPSRPMKLRRASASSSSLTSAEAPAVTISKPSGKESRSRRQGSTRSIIAAVFDKENATLNLSATPDIPFTPIRSHSTSSPRSNGQSRVSPSGSRTSRRSSLLRSVVAPALFRPPAGMTPSPASSSELSPVGKKMMMDVRRQRSMMMEMKEGRSHGGGGGRRGHQRSERVA